MGASLNVEGRMWGGGRAWNNDTFKLNKVMFELSNVEIKLSTIEFDLNLFALLNN